MEETIARFNAMNASLTHQTNYEWLMDTITQLYGSKTVHTVAPTNFVEEWWLKTVLYFGDLNLLVAFYIFMNFCYMIGALFFFVIDKFHLLHKYKIQQERYPTKVDYVKCIKNLVQNYVIVIFPLIYVIYPLAGYLKFQIALPLPNLFTFCWQLFFCIVTEDILHYWLHRALHVPWLYKRIHKVHHTFSAPFGLTASYAHPLEVIILGIPTFLGPFVLQSHYFVFFSFILYRQLDAVGTHSGYDLPHLFDLLPYYGGIKLHDFHHKNFIFNYSSRFFFMDKWFGTYKEPI